MRSVDFISQDFFEHLHDPEGTRLPEDALGHGALAETLLRAATSLPPGTVIALQGAWGRGKTDVLARVAARTWPLDKQDLPPGIADGALWINPWQYGTPDLLTPLVAELVKRARSRARFDTEALRRGARTIIEAGISFGMKAAAVVLPVAGGIAEAAQEPMDKLVGALFDGPGEKVDVDPVAAMGRRFRELVEVLVPPPEAALGARLLICIDDLDRCLPDRQVALLQAFRFLLSAQAPVTFLVALDPVLVREAVRTHYRGAQFDVDRYLDKLFELRVNLPGVAEPSLAKVIGGHLRRELQVDGRPSTMRVLATTVLGFPAEDLAEELRVLLSKSGLANPRIIRRLMDRLHLFCVARGSQKLNLPPVSGMAPAHLVAVWLIVCDRWPAVRNAVQDAGFGERWREIRSMYLDYVQFVGDPVTRPQALDLAEHKARRWLVPSPVDAPALIALLETAPVLEGSREVVVALEAFDQALVAAGL